VAAINGKRRKAKLSQWRSVGENVKKPVA
jgi:hypothetical protein